MLFRLCTYILLKCKIKILERYLKKGISEFVRLQYDGFE